MGSDALGSGVWMPLSMLYFLHQTSLSLVQLGLAMTLANTAVIPAVPLLGSLVDRVGPRWVMQIGNAGAAAAFVLYPFAHSLAAVTVLVSVSTLTRSAFWSALGPMVTRITEPGEREIWFGFLQAMRNAGYGVGGVLAAVALTFGSSTAYQSVVLANAASYVVAFVLMLGVRGGRRALAGAPPERGSGGPWVAFGDPAYRVLVAVSFCYALVQGTLNVAMPVYVVDTLSLPGWVSGAVFVTNTVMVGLGQGLVVRAMTGVLRARVLHIAVACSAVSFAVLYVASYATSYAAAVSVTAGVVVVLVGVVVFTMGELTAGPVVAALSAEAAPAAASGRYMAAVQLARVTSYAVGPLLYSAALDRGPLTMWGGALVLCVIWAGLVAMLSARMPLASEPVTNVAEADVVADPGLQPDPHARLRVTTAGNPRTPGAGRAQLPTMTSACDETPSTSRTAGHRPRRWPGP